MSLNILSGAFVITGIVLGYGIITLPVGFAYLGYLGGCIFLLLMAFISFLTIKLIFLSCKKIKKDREALNNFHPITFNALLLQIHPIFKFMTILSSLCFSFLATVTYQNCLIFFFQRIYTFLFKRECNKILISIFIAGIQIAFSFLKDLKSFSFIGLVSAASCLYVCGLCIFTALQFPEIETIKFDLEGFKQSFGNFIFVFCCTQLIPGIYSELEKGTNINIMTLLGIGMSFVLSLLIGLGGYFCGGSDLKKYTNILLFFLHEKEKMNFLSFFAVSSFSVILLISYAFQCFSARQTIIQLLKSTVKLGIGEFAIKRNLIFPYVLLTTVFSLFIYERSVNLLNFNGMIFGNFLSFFFPAICYLNICKKSNAMYFYLSLLIILFGISSLLFTLFY